MSGDLLRRSAIFGDVDNIKCQLEQGSNPCSVDVSETYPLYGAIVPCRSSLLANTRSIDPLL